MITWVGVRNNVGYSYLCFLLRPGPVDEEGGDSAGVSWGGREERQNPVAFFNQEGEGVALEASVEGDGVDLAVLLLPDLDDGPAPAQSIRPPEKGDGGVDDVGGDLAVLELVVCIEQIAR